MSGKDMDIPIPSGSNSAKNGCHLDSEWSATSSLDGLTSVAAPPIVAPDFSHPKLEDGSGSLLDVSLSADQFSGSSPEQMQCVVERLLEENRGLKMVVDTQKLRIETLQGENKLLRQPVKIEMDAGRTLAHSADPMMASPTGSVRMGGPPPPPPGAPAPGGPAARGGGPPPPPPPRAGPLPLPFGMAQKAVYKDKIPLPLRKANWNKIPPVKLTRKSFWVKVCEDKYANEELIQSLTQTFGFKTTTNRPIKGIRGTLSRKEPTKLRILSAEVAQNFAISTKPVIKSVENLETAILECDIRLKGDVLLQMINTMPSLDEIRKLQELPAKEKSELVAEEKLALAIGSIWDIRPRLEAMVFHVEFDQIVEDTDQDIVAVTAASEELMNSPKLAKLLSVLLLIGNILNSGSDSGAAIGFDLVYLTQMRNTKTCDNTKTLLHFLLEALQTYYPDTMSFAEELPHSYKVAREEYPIAGMWYQERLILARLCHDVPGAQRAYMDMGCCHFAMEQYTWAEQYFLKVVSLTDERDLALQADACYMIGNTFFLLKEHAKSIDFYDKHYQIARALRNGLDESRACWRLGAAYAAKGEWKPAVHFAKEHLRLAREFVDDEEAAFAQTNVSQYAERAEGQPGTPEDFLLQRIFKHDPRPSVPEMIPPSKSMPEPALSGASDDLKKASELASNMVKIFGMSEKVGLRYYGRDDDRDIFTANKDLAPNAAETIDTEIKKIPQVETLQDPEGIIAAMQSMRLEELRADSPGPLSPLRDECTIFTEVESVQSIQQRRPPLRKSFVGLRRVKDMVKEAENRPK